MLAADAYKVIIAVFVELHGLLVHKNVLDGVSRIRLDAEAEVFSLGGIKTVGSDLATL